MSPRPFFFLGGGGRGWTTSAAAAREAPALRMATAGQPPGLGGMNGLWEGGGGGKGLDPPIMAWSWGQGWLRPSWGCTEAIGRALNNSTIKYKHKGKSLN